MSPLTLLERLQSKQTQNKKTGADTCLLLDVSGSMAGFLPSGKTKIDSLKEVIQDFSGVRQFSFSDECEEAPPTDARGGTNMAEAFYTVKRAGLRRCVLVTDGLPDSAQAALEAVSGLSVNIIYVGPLPAPQFLRDLALRTKSAFSVESFTATKELKSTIRLLLEKK